MESASRRTYENGSSRHDLWVRRSALIFPANVPKFYEQAHLRGADALVLDLEDSVAAEQKMAARQTFSEALQAAQKGNVPVLVRVNNEFPELVRDLDACVQYGVDEVMFPKIESADQVKVLDALLREREILRDLPQGRLRVSLVIESTVGLENALSIAQASSRISTLALGAEDLKRELRIDAGDDGDLLVWAHNRIVVAAYAAGITPLGYPGSIADYRDIDKFERAVERGRCMGYMGGYCIHPRQIEVLNRKFSPSKEQVAWAQKVADAFSSASAEGRASVSVDGQMVDIPVAEQAHGILERSCSVKEFENHKANVG